MNERRRFEKQHKINAIKLLETSEKIATAIAADLGFTRDALSMTMTPQIPVPGLVFHSDHGVQYAVRKFREKIKEHRKIQSMSRKGDRWENACARVSFLR